MTRVPEIFYFDPAKHRFSVPEAFFFRALLKAKPWLPPDLCWQYPFPGTRYQLDVGIPSRALDVEIDGFLHEQPGGVARDAKRDQVVRAAGWEVMRIPGNRLVDSMRNLAPARYAVTDYPGAKADDVVRDLITFLGLPAPSVADLGLPQRIPAEWMGRKVFTADTRLSPPAHPWR